MFYTDFLKQKLLDRRFRNKLQKSHTQSPNVPPPHDLFKPSGHLHAGNVACKLGGHPALRPLYVWAVTNPAQCAGAGKLNYLEVDSSVKEAAAEPGAR